MCREEKIIIKTANEILSNIVQNLKRKIKKEEKQKRQERKQKEIDHLIEQLREGKDITVENLINVLHKD